MPEILKEMPENAPIGQIALDPKTRELYQKRENGWTRIANPQDGLDYIASLKPLASIA